MEKITLKPLAKELIFRNGEPDTSFDVQSFQGTSIQEKLLGSLFVISHAKYSSEDLAYAVSLVSSLAKREYYSDFSLQEQNAKSSFERTLKKLNEVLDDFFKNKDLKFNIGLLAISGDNIYISRLGKFKIALARNDDYIDVLNNIDLFSKDMENEKQFSNIISGKLKTGDKIFAYFPTKAIILREKMLNPIFVKEDQEEFSEKIAHLAANANNFSCCGVHVTMREIKEIPVQFMPRYSMPNITKTETATPEKPVATSYSKADRAKGSKSVENEPPEPVIFEKQEKPNFGEQPKIISAEFSVAKRGNPLTLIANRFSKLASIGRLPRKARSKIFVTIAAIVIVPLLVFVFIKSAGDSGKARTAITKAKDDLKIAQSRLTQNNRQEARSLFQTALLGISGFSGKNVETMRNQINHILDNVDNVSDKIPKLFSSALAQNKDFKSNLITASDNKPVVADIDGNAFAVSQASVNSLGKLIKTSPKFLFDSGTAVFAFNGADAFGIYGKSKKISSYPLKESIQAVDADLYENNLYVLLSNQVLKYTDAGAGSTKSAKWSKDAIVDPLSITADGNIYILTKNGKIAKYFKGTKISEFDTQITPSAENKIFTNKSLAFVYLTDKTNKKVYVFDKASGELKTAFKLDAAGAIQDISISQNGNIWTLSADNKVWQVQP